MPHRLDNRFKHLIEQIPAIAVQGYNEDREVIYWNRASETLYGYTKQEALGKKLEELIIPEFMRKDVVTGIQNWIDNDIAIPAMELVLLDKYGNEVEVYSQHVMLEVDDNKKEMFCLDMDMHQLKESERKLQKQNDIFELAEQNAHVGNWEMNLKSRKINFSDELYRIFGFDTFDVTPNLKFLYNHLSYDLIHEIYHTLPKVIKDRKPRELEHEVIRLNGEKRFVRSRGIIAYNADNEAETFYGTVLDITDYHKARQDLQAQQKALFYQANHDNLSGLANRTLFLDRLSQAVIRRNDKYPYHAVLFLDLDHFKNINDTVGHSIGDLVLIAISRRLEKILRAEDTVARFGGDEFAILLENISSPLEVSTIAQKIIDIFKQAIEIEKNKFYITASIGIAISPDDSMDSETLLRYADSAMYKAKGSGRNSYAFYTSDLSKRALERVKMENSIREAIKKEQFVLYFQAQVDAKTNTLIGMEALIRWIHPTKGIISPDEFIPLSEETGQIIEIGKWVLTKAISTMKSWREKGIDFKNMSINISAKQLQDENFIDFVTKLVQKFDCKLDKIELEVTESYMMQDPKQAIEILNKLHKLGFKMAVDDFGMGYSSLSYLKKLPIDKLKIDQSFICDIPGDSDDESIVKAVILIAQSMNLKVIAEGVETEQQREFLLKNGCENIQGYLYSKPIPQDKMQEFIRDFR